MFTTMPLVLLGVLLCSAVQASADGLPLPDLRRSLGQPVALDRFVDHAGRPLRDIPGDARPWIVAPIYTRCSTTCAPLADGLRRALTASELRPSEYRVLMLSFDPQESNGSLAAFRERLSLPDDWSTVRAVDRDALEPALRALDFRTIEMDDGRFEHPNLVAVLDADRRVSGYVYGVAPSASELRGAVRRAAAGDRDVGHMLRWLPAAAAACGLLLSAMLFIVTLMTPGRARGSLRHSSVACSPAAAAAAARTSQTQGR